MGVKYVLKEPVDAVLFDKGNMEEVQRFIDELNDVPAKPVICQYMHAGVAGMYIYTFHGTQYVKPGTWIIRDAQGEYCPCSRDYFERLYSPVAE